MTKRGQALDPKFTDVTRLVVTTGGAGCFYATIHSPLGNCVSAPSTVFNFDLENGPFTVDWLCCKFRFFKTEEDGVEFTVLEMNDEHRGPIGVEKSVEFWRIDPPEDSTDALPEPRLEMRIYSSDDNEPQVEMLVSGTPHSDKPEFDIYDEHNQNLEVRDENRALEWSLLYEPSEVEDESETLVLAV